MVSFEQAVKNVRKAFPDILIDRGFEYEGKYIFYIYERPNLEHQVESFGVYIYVLPDGKVVTADYDEIFENSYGLDGDGDTEDVKLKKFSEAYDNGIRVDEPPEYSKEFDNWVNDIPKIII